ncbi:MAG: VirB8/TrbF family protein [Betaproteobacteria bacterium]|nr:VirB8/TrbF family protein [Betaproteobacteria bacterium]
MSKVSPDYMAARREWLERYGDYIAQARNWRTMAFGAIAIAALFGAGMVYEAQRVKVEPYVVEVDKLGESVRLAQAIQTGAARQPIVTHVLSHWLVDVRERIGDPNAEKAAILDAYTYMTQDSGQALGNYMNQDPMYAASDPNSGVGSRTVEIHSALPLGNPTPKGGTYQIQWTERTHGKDGSLVSTQRWTGIVSYVLLPPDVGAHSTQQLLQNPFGIYITSFQWQQTL